MCLMSVMRSSPVITRYGEFKEHIFVVIAQLAVYQLTGSKDRDGMSLYCCLVSKYDHLLDGMQPCQIVAGIE